MYSDSDVEGSHDASSNDEEEGEEDGNNLLKPNGRPWTELESLDMDPASDTRFKQNAQILYSEDEELTALQDRGPSFYFYHFFPMKTIPKILDATNGLMKERYGYGNISKGELVKWFGIQLAMCIEPRRGGVDAYFNPKDDDETSYTGADMAKRFEMNKARYMKIRECLRFHTHEGENSIENVSTTRR